MNEPNLQLIANLKVALAVAEDPALAWQYKINGTPHDWMDGSEGIVAELFLDSRRLQGGYELRLRPLPPAPRSWSRAEDVPGPVCWLTWTGEMDGCSYLITEVSNKGVKLGETFHPWSEFGSDRIRHSTTRRADDWHPCTTEEPLPVLAQALKTVMGERQWRSIETAPKDGTKILATIPISDVPNVVFWCASGCWKIQWDHSDLRIIDTPTHWMPLPPVARLNPNEKEGK